MIKQLSFLPIGSKSNRFPIGFVFLLSTILICALWIAKQWMDIPYQTLLQPPMTLFQLPFYTGFFFQIGVFFWSASITVCFFVSKILSSRAGRARMSRFLFVSGSLTLIFCLDDVFQVHEQLAALLGVFKFFILPGYGAFLILYLIAYYSLISRTSYELLGIALLFFGFSLAIDLTQVEYFDAILFGGLSKMIGLISWMVYFFLLGKKVLLSPSIPNGGKLHGVSSEMPRYHYN